jgi:AcrR family transcriptional regulator
MPRSSREKSLETRVKIVDAAYHLFIERGYSATAMRDISHQAGVTVGAIYHHFQTKEEIWVEVILNRHPYHEILPIILAAQGDTIAAVVRSSARSMTQELLKRPDLFNLLFIEFVEFKAAHVSSFYQAILPQLAQLQALFRGKPGKLRDIPAPIMLRSFVGLFFSYYVTGIMMRDLNGISTDPASLDRFVDLYLYGILQGDGQAESEAE